MCFLLKLNVLVAAHAFPSRRSADIKVFNGSPAIAQHAGSSGVCGIKLSSTTKVRQIRRNSGRALSRLEITARQKSWHTRTGTILTPLKSLVARPSLVESI